VRVLTDANSTDFGTLPVAGRGQPVVFYRKLDPAFQACSAVQISFSSTGALGVPASLKCLSITLEVEPSDGIRPLSE